MAKTSNRIENAEQANPNIRQQNDEWRKQRVARGEDPNDAEAFRQHVQAIGAPDPGEGKVADPRGATSREASGVKDQVAGTLKEAVGRAVGNEQAQAEGQAQRESGRISRAAD